MYFWNDENWLSFEDYLGVNAVRRGSLLILTVKVSGLLLESWNFSLMFSGESPSWLSASNFTRNYAAKSVFFLASRNKRFHTLKTSYNLLHRVLSGWEIQQMRNAEVLLPQDRKAHLIIISLPLVCKAWLFKNWHRYILVPGRSGKFTGVAKVHLIAGTDTLFGCLGSNPNSITS